MQFTIEQREKNTNNMFINGWEILKIKKVLIK